MDNSQMKAGPAEIKKSMVAALVREREGYKRRLDLANALPDDDEKKKAEAIADAERRIAEVSSQLAHFGAEAAAPAKRAERRPVSARAEQR